MKKMLLSICLSLSFVLVNSVVKAEDAQYVEGLRENYEKVLMEYNFSEEEINEMYNDCIDDFTNDFWNRLLPGKKHLGKIECDTDEEEYQLELERFKKNIYFNNGVLVNKLSTRKYIKQYADNNKFHYLLSGEQFWSVNSIEVYFSTSGELFSDVYCMKNNIDFPWFIISDYRLVKDIDYLNSEIVRMGESEVNDIMLFSLSSSASFIYIRCGENEYLGKLNGSVSGKTLIPQIEEGILYPASEIAEALIDPNGTDFIPKQNIIKDASLVKPTYETEAIALQNDGLLYGNENGLDLLKPLTRIEATAMLVRILGMEENAVSGESYFSDIPSDNWGAKYANIAYDAGIAAGVGDNLFAPNDIITSSQFVTLLLRSQNQEADWQTAVNTFVENGILTQEQADKMDLFTRGDMAKIIYEAREKGIF